MTVPMPSSHQDFVSKSARLCRAVLDLNEALIEIDAFWAGTPNYDSLIDQAEIDSVPSFADNGLTTVILADGEAALAGVKNEIASAFTQLLSLSRFG